jgi:hypothetical protein
MVMRINGRIDARGGRKQQGPAVSTQNSTARTCGAMWRACTDVTVNTPSL